MTRPAPENVFESIEPPLADEIKLKKDDLIRQVRQYKLITPLFGGGVEPSENDTLTPISGKTIRGHLRFWWRATRGGRFEGNLERMKSREAEIWGAAIEKDNACPSQIQIEVAEINAENQGRSALPYGANGRANVGWEVLAYAAFPLESDPKSVLSDLGFSLRITYPPTLSDEVDAALWAWEIFGGIGARTRRGFGSLMLIALEEKGEACPVERPPSVNDVRKWIDAKLKQFDVKGTWHPHVSHLSPLMSSTWLKVTQAKHTGQQKKGEQDKAPLSPIEVWKYLIGKLKEFRQARFDKKTYIATQQKTRNPFGISRWPEANEIRRRWGMSAKIVDASTPPKFPRAQFGLPINFHLPHDADEPNIVLQGQNTPRRGSPLILRPLTCLDGKTVGLALLLEPHGLPPGHLVLDEVAGQSSDVARDLTELTVEEAFGIEPLHREKNVLKAFLDTIS